MPASEPLYFLTNVKQYKDAKINLLSARSSLLISRNLIKEVKQNMLGEEEQKKLVKHASLETLKALKKIETLLPKINAPKIKEPLKKIKSKQPPKFIAPTIHSEQNEIDSELESINSKLKELSSL